MTEPGPECSNDRICAIFLAVFSLLFCQFWWPNTQMTEFICSPNFVRQKNRVRTFVRTWISPKFGQPEPEFIDPNPTRFFIRTRPNVWISNSDKKMMTKPDFFRIGQIQVFGSGNFLPTLVLDNKIVGKVTEIYSKLIACIEQTKLRYHLLGRSNNMDFAKWLKAKT